MNAGHADTYPAGTVLNFTCLVVVNLTRSEWSPTWLQHSIMLTALGLRTKVVEASMIVMALLPPAAANLHFLCQRM